MYEEAIYVHALPVWNLLPSQQLKMVTTLVVNLLRQHARQP